MEKIVLVINANKPDMASIDFACRIATIAKTKLTGLFIESVYEQIPANLEKSSYYNTTSKRYHYSTTSDTEQAVRLFKDECHYHGISPEINLDKGEPIDEVISESRFADLVIIDPDINFYDSEEQFPSHFVKQLLSKIECPILLAPEKYEDPDEIVFCYDGSASAVFAIKQFTYLFPELRNKKVMLLEVNRSGKEEFNDNHRKMMEWLRTHYYSAYYHALCGDVKDELFNYFFMKRKKMIVMGAYGRSMLSNFFKKSNADVLIRMVDLPMFISHY